jgi:hypothetical protein
MARMVDLILAGSAPTAIMRRAAQGTLSLPASEAIEILVALTGDRELGAEAEQTLESWDEPSLIEVASSAETPAGVLLYLLQYHARRPSVVAALCENPGLPLAELEAAARHGEAGTLQAMTQSARVLSSSRLLELMAANPAAEPARPKLNEWLAAAQGRDAEEIAAHFLMRHADEVARVDGQRFELVASAEGEDDPLDQLMTRVKNGETPVGPEEIKQLSLLQRLDRMRVGERIKQAVRGNREERMVLIRDRSKLVSLAVLESPKVSETEMEAFASMKNIQESVLRAISTKRKYIKVYGVMRALANNPKTPLDVALPLLAHLLIQDVRALAMNKNVNETVRKLALKLYRIKNERKQD